MVQRGHRLAASVMGEAKAVQPLGLVPAVPDPSADRYCRAEVVEGGGQVTCAESGLAEAVQRGRLKSRVGDLPEDGQRRGEFGKAAFGYAHPDVGVPDVV